MSEHFTAIKVTDRVYWVGAIDWGIRNFHGYNTSRGTTYNAYLVLGDKITLVDTVKAPFRDEMFSRISSVVEPERIEFIISNHAEQDHTGCLVDAVDAIGPEKVFASAMGVKALMDNFHHDHDITAVKNGETLELGGMNFTFIETRMLHWPDSMFTYLADEKVLFSQDAFGMHLAGSERFADEIDDALLRWEAAKYYANILLPLSSFVKKLLDTYPSLGLDVETLAPDHGPVWRGEGDIGKILSLYGQWADQNPTPKAVVVYDTMWGATEKMARAIGDGVIEGGAKAVLCPLGSCHRSDVATEILDAGALLVGSPTINSSVFPTIADALCYLKGLKPLKLIGAAFGSFGWSGEAVKHVRAILDEMGVEHVGEDVRVRYAPDAEGIEKCRQLGLLTAEKLKQICS